MKLIQRKERFAYYTLLLIPILICLLSPTTSPAQSRILIKTDDLKVTYGGYIKSLTTFTYNEDTDTESWDSHMRLRLKIEGRFRSRLKAVIHYELATLWGESLSDPNFRESIVSDPDDFANLYWNITTTSDIMALSTLDRAYLSIYFDYLTLTIGRQRIAWGTSRFISPLDLFNPFDPADIDKEEKLGVDALVAEIPLGDVSGLSMVLVPSKDMDNASYALRLYTNVFDYDIAIVAGRFRDREVYGIDFSGQIWDVAVYGELALNMEDTQDEYMVPDPLSPFGFSPHKSKREYIRATMGAEYIFPNTFSILLEYYYNGKGEENRDDYNLEALAAGDETTLARNYLFMTLGYQFTPLVNGTFSIFYNLDDASVMFAPSVEYSATESLYFNLGAQINTGTLGSEYRMGSDLFYLQVRYYF